MDYSENKFFVVKKLVALWIFAIFVAVSGRMLTVSK